MDAADVPYHYRDYCAHMYIDYKECRLTSGFSWRTKCAHELHAYNKCEYKEFKVSPHVLLDALACSYGIRSSVEGREGHWRKGIGTGNTAW